MTTYYSIIIPAYNEQDWLPKTLSTLHKAMDTLSLPGEVIVVDNNSGDRTPRIARKHNAQVVFEPVNQISRARNTGARAAKGSHLIFLDADTILSADLLQTALSNLASGKCCGGGVLVDFDKPIKPLARAALNFWNRAALKFGLAAGCFIYCLREGFEAVGGFSEKVFASEEIWFSRQLQTWGRKRQMAFQVIPSPRIVTSGRKLEWFTPFEMILTGMMITIFPFTLRFRIACMHWYYRPDRKSSRLN